jgi:hypothetical protein
MKDLSQRQEVRSSRLFILFFEPLLEAFEIKINHRRDVERELL